MGGESSWKEKKTFLDIYQPEMIKEHRYTGHLV